MWKAVVGHDVSVKVESQGDDWDTDPDFENDISEKEQRWGAKTIEGSGRGGEHIDIHQLRSKVSEEHESLKRKELEAAPQASYGYGGKFGTEKDRMDKAALGHEYVAEIGIHSSQTDASKGFGGKYGVQKDRADKSALGFDYKGEVEKHTSQKDYALGFGGKFGLQKDRQDKSALGWAHKEEVKPHESQTDYAVGFGGKFGVQKDRQDKSAFDWTHKEELKPHESQTDYAVGFGGKFGVQKDRQDKSALGWDHKEELKPHHESQTDYTKGFGGRYGVQKDDRMDKSAAGFREMEAPGSSYEKTKLAETASSGAGSLRRRFENMAKVAEEENQKRAETERAQRQAQDQKERQAALEQQKKREVNHFKESSQHADLSHKEPVPSLPLVPKMVFPEARLPPRPPTQLGVAVEEGEVQPPGLPTLNLDTLETPRRLPTLPLPVQQPLCTETSDDGDDYDDVHPEPPSLQEEEEEEEAVAAGGEYEDMPPHISHEEVIYDEGTDGGQDYEEIPHRIPSGSGVKGPSSEAEDCVYEAVEESLSAVALYDYQGDGDDEISFYPGDTITDIEQVDEGWWRGRCHGKEGLFPANYVDLLH